MNRYEEYIQDRLKGNIVEFDDEHDNAIYRTSELLLQILDLLPEGAARNKLILYILIELQQEEEAMVLGKEPDDVPEWQMEYLEESNLIKALIDDFVKEVKT